jgi:hypothetical protein
MLPVVCLRKEKKLMLSMYMHILMSGISIGNIVNVILNMLLILSW